MLGTGGGEGRAEIGRGDCQNPRRNQLLNIWARKVSSELLYVPQKWPSPRPYTIYSPKKGLRAYGTSALETADGTKPRSPKSSTNHRVENAGFQGLWGLKA